jgi:hypothetical protein
MCLFRKYEQHGKKKVPGTPILLNTYYRYRNRIVIEFFYNGNPDLDTSRHVEGGEGEPVVEDILLQVPEQEHGKGGEAAARLFPEGAALDTAPHGLTGPLDERILVFGFEGLDGVLHDYLHNENRMISIINMCQSNNFKVTYNGKAVAFIVGTGTS